MENIYIDMRKQGFTLSNHFKNKDMVSVEDVLTELENTLEKIDCLQEEFDDYKDYVKDNYKELSQEELIGYNPRDFYEE